LAGKTFEDEGAGADRPGGEAIGIFANGLGRDHGQPGLGEHIEEGFVRLAQVGAKGVLVDDFSMRVGDDVAAGEGRFGGGIAHVLEVDEHGFGVEFCAVAEGDVVAQVKRVGEPVGRDVPGFSQPGRSSKIGVAVNEVVVNEPAIPRHVEGGDGMGVEIGEVAGGGEAQDTTDGVGRRVFGIFGQLKIRERKIDKASWAGGVGG